MCDFVSNAVVAVVQNVACDVHKFIVLLPCLYIEQDKNNKYHDKKNKYRKINIFVLIYLNDLAYVRLMLETIYTYSNDLLFMYFKKLISNINLFMTDFFPVYNLNHL